MEVLKFLNTLISRLLMECGRLVQNEEREDGGLPTIVKPGFSEMLLFEKNVIGGSIPCSSIFY